jgi:hypothetical protein
MIVGLYSINVYKIANSLHPITGVLRSEVNGETFSAVLLMNVTKHAAGEGLQYGGRIQSLEGKAILPGEYMLMLKDNLRGRISVQDVSAAHDNSVCEYVGHEDLWIAE